MSCLLAFFRKIYGHILREREERVRGNFTFNETREKIFKYEKDQLVSRDGVNKIQLNTKQPNMCATTKNQRNCSRC